MPEDVTITFCIYICKAYMKEACRKIKRKFKEKMKV